MYSEVLSITKIRELYVFLLSVDKTNFSEISMVFGIKHRGTIRKYMDVIEEIYNVEVVSSAGRDGGTRLYRRGKDVRLGREEEKTLVKLLEGGYRLTPEMKRSLYSILYRSACTKETEEFLKNIRPKVFND